MKIKHLMKTQITICFLPLSLSIKQEPLTDSVANPKRKGQIKEREKRETEPSNHEPSAENNMKGNLKNYKKKKEQPDMLQMLSQHNDPVKLLSLIYSRNQHQQAYVQKSQ